MRTSISRSLVALALAFSLLPLSACTKEPITPPEQEKEEEITLAASNARDYIGVNFSFGELSKMSSESSEKERISCIAYIEVFPIGEYRFKSTKVVLTMEQSFLGDYTLMRGLEWLPEEKRVTLTLDKNGYGSACLYLHREYSKNEEDVFDPFMFPKRLRHPSEAGTWSVKISAASGTVIENK
ncbi:MAG: hypothetical protein J6D16_00145 [Clostridia bacterium]|nr:hypothetical protein [Clostridia bacterium]